MILRRNRPLLIGLGLSGACFILLRTFLSMLQFGGLTAPAVSIPAIEALTPVLGQPTSRRSVDIRLPLSLKNIIPADNGNVDVVLNLNMKELFNALDGLSPGNLNGEATDNPLPCNFTITDMNPNICKTRGLKWIIYIHSAPGNFARRKLVRETWGNKNLYKDHRTNLVFLLGMPPERSLQEVVEDEQKKYGDIVQGSFIESYKNLTLKAIMGLKYVTEYCPHVEFAIKADDDAFINIFEMMKVVGRQVERERLVVCPLWKRNSMPILRDPAKCMKWCVRYNEFPGKNFFPPYCAGLGYVLSAGVVPELYRASKSTPFFWIDDVYVSGLLLNKIPKVNMVDTLRNFTLKQDLAIQDYTKTSGNPSYIFAHIRDGTKFQLMWNKTLGHLSAEELQAINPTVLQLHPELQHKLQG